jgi:hypothetical protein
MDRLEGILPSALALLLRNFAGPSHGRLIGEIIAKLRSVLIQFHDGVAVQKRYMRCKSCNKAIIMSPYRNTSILS